MRNCFLKYWHVGLLHPVYDSVCIRIRNDYSCASNIVDAEVSEQLLMEQTERVAIQSCTRKIEYERVNSKGRFLFSFESMITPSFTERVCNMDLISSVLYTGSPWSDRERETRAT